MPSVLIKVKKIYFSCFTSYVQCDWNITLLPFLFFSPQVARLPTRCFYFMSTLIIPLCDPKDWSPPGSSVHGILQARILGWVAICFSRRCYPPRDWTQIFCICRLFADWVTREANLQVADTSNWTNFYPPKEYMIFAKK